MRRSVLVIVVTAAAACTSGPDDVVGPFTGPIKRFVVDRIEVPVTVTTAEAVADDIDGDGDLDNQGGKAIVAMRAQGDGDDHVADKIASGALASFVTIQADDLADDPTVAVAFLGADGAPATAMGGRIVDSAFASNRLATTRVPGAAIVHLPAFADSDPVVVAISALEVELLPDAGGGYAATFRGGMKLPDVIEPAIDALLQMAAFDPQAHIAFARIVDVDGDGVLMRSELANSNLFVAMMEPDVRLFDGDRYAPGHDGDPESLAIAFTAHLAPCATGNCALATPANTCFDRVLDGDETDLDCGGSCQPCPGAARCAVAGDCQTATCEPAGTCAQPTCSDGIRDGFEQGVDCGGVCGVCPQ
jgi:hypothetical protein